MLTIKEKKLSRVSEWVSCSCMLWVGVVFFEIKTNSVPLGAWNKLGNNHCTNCLPINSEGDGHSYSAGCKSDLC